LSAGYTHDRNASARKARLRSLLARSFLENTYEK